jgi:holo-[acyl-carrier protein] synthase
VNMQHHIGTDIIEIERIRKAIKRWGDRFLNRVFTKDELRLYGHRAHSLAASFASKEAVMKLLGTGNRGVAWREIETLYHPTGKPIIRLNGRAKKQAEKLGIKEIDVSLSHSRENAVATAIGST